MAAALEEHVAIEGQMPADLEDVAILLDLEVVPKTAPSLNRPPTRGGRRQERPVGEHDVRVGGDVRRPQRRRRRRCRRPPDGGRGMPAETHDDEASGSCIIYISFPDE